MRILLPALSLALTGCSTLRIHSVAPEVTFQTLNAVDFSETIDDARSPSCYQENDPFTRAMIGEHPSSKGVAEAWAVYAVGHYAVTAWLDREIEANDSDTWRVIRFVWHVGTIAGEVHSLADNARAGLTPFQGKRRC